MDAWTIVRLTWRYAPMLTRFVSRPAPRLHDYAKVITAILRFEGISCGDVPEVRSLWIGPIVNAPTVVHAKCFFFPGKRKGLIVVRHEIAEDPGISVPMFVIGHEMGHFVQFFDEYQPSDHWLIRRLHQHNAEKEYFCDAMSWFCRYWMLCFAEGKPVDPEAAWAYILDRITQSGRHTASTP